jgi:NADH-quinone oxidoreductase subunit G
MPRLTIDNQTVEVPPGTKVIQAAEQLGIQIPRFCYHPALGSVGACRVCAVKVIKGPPEGIQMSCMLEAREGMVVSTTDPEAVDFRRHVIEWLMLNHPHDCPVCDEGGHCLLQDLTVAGGHGRRRYKGPKRTFPDQDLGPLVQHEMNRCIHCYRCVRFYREYAGGKDLGGMGIGARTYFGRASDGPLESPFAGNLIDVCPTGVYTDKPSRFKGRRWDFERAPGICLNCALGCHVTVSARYRQVVRCEARYSPQVNGYFICDRGRYGFTVVSDPARPREARIKDRTVPWPEAVAEIRRRLEAVVADAGPRAVALAVSLDSSLETQAVARRLCDSLGWQGPGFWSDAASRQANRRAAALATPDLALDLAAAEAADRILVVGCDPLNEAPVLALALRQAVRRGAVVTVVDPRPVQLPFDFEALAVDRRDMAAWLKQVNQGLASGDLPGAAAAAADPLRLAAVLKTAVRPLVVGGLAMLGEGAVAEAARLARQLKADALQKTLLWVPQAANAFGAALFSPEAGDWEQMLADIESGAVKALVLVEDGGLDQVGDLARAARALARLELLVVMDWAAGAAVDRADVFLPLQAWPETPGTHVNAAGRAQRQQAAFRGGTPIRDTGGGDHPPRTFREDIPGSAPRPAWQALAEAAGADDLAAAGTVDDLWRLLAAHLPAAAALAEAAPFDVEGTTVLRGRAAPPEAVERAGEEAASASADLDTLTLLWVPLFLGTERRAAHSKALQALEGEATIWMHPGDAVAWGLADGDLLRCGEPSAEAVFRLRLTARMAPGAVLVPRLQRLRRQGWGLPAKRLRREDLRKE